MASATTDYDFLTYDSTWAIDFAPNGTRLGLGDTMTRKRYANTLEAIAERGVDVFYKGAIANATIQALQKANGTMTLTDLANYTVAIRPTSNITYRGYKIFSGSAPSSGAVVLSALKIAEGFDMSTPSELNYSTHYLDEGMRFGYGQRTLLGDPAYFPNLTSYQQRMVSDGTAAALRAKINRTGTLNATAYNPDQYGILQDDGTSATVASDKSGLTIAMTSTVNLLFGSKLLVPETGVIMNNEMNGKLTVDIEVSQAKRDLRFQHSRHEKRFWICPKPSELPSPIRSTPIFHLTINRAISIRQAIHHGRCSGWLTYYYRCHSTPLAYD
jgi:gamma-glutamyltranspeptidase/glutathione hydrolase